MADHSEQESAKSKSRSHGVSIPLMVIIVLVLVLNLLIVGKVFLGSHGNNAGSKAQQAAQNEVGKKLSLDEFLVNLADPGGDHYLKASIALGLRKDLDEKKLEEDMAPIKDVIITVLSGAKQADTATAEGKEKLKSAIKERVNQKLGDAKIVEVYFTAFATQ